MIGALRLESCQRLPGADWQARSSVVRSILLSFAHPDDESFIAGGTACKYGAEGVRIVLCTATLGEAGKAGKPPVCSPEELPRVREAELRTACDVLGIRVLHLLGHRDRELSAAPEEQVRRQLVQLIRRYRPELVITFDPNGANLHPDHIAISRFTADAVAASADARWFAEVGAAHTVQRLLWTPPVRVYDEPPLPPLASQPGIDFVIDTRQWWRQKADALQAHRSQHLSIDRLWFHRPDIKSRLSLELFRQAWGPPLRQRPASDLFEGLE